MCTCTCTCVVVQCVCVHAYMYIYCTRTCISYCVGATHHVLLCVAAGLDPITPMETVFKHFNLDQNTIDFIGRALALYRGDGEFMHLCYD